MGKIIGIDLGTTNSCVAIMDGTTRTRAGERRRRSHHAFYHCLYPWMVKLWLVSRLNVRQ